MKKSLIALFVAAFCFSSMAQVLVYDFNASFKRLDDKSVKYNYKKNGEVVKNAHMDSAKVVSDKFTGYMVIDACKDCEGNMDYSHDQVMEGRYDVLDLTDAEKNPIKAKSGKYFWQRHDESDKDTEKSYAIFYIVRKGDKDKNVYRSAGEFSADMFGAQIFKRDGKFVHKNGEVMDLATAKKNGKFTDALGYLSIPLNWEGKVYKGEKTVTNENGEETKEHVWERIPGFLGYANSSNQDNNELFAQGYGKVTRKVVKDETKTYHDKCDGDEVETIPGTSCWMVKNLSGSVVGNTNYTGICGNFIFDVCSLDDNFDAPMPGTFTLKLNNSLTYEKGDFRFADFADAEDDILKKLKFDATKDTLWGPGNVDEPTGLNATTYWPENKTAWPQE